MIAELKYCLSMRDFMKATQELLGEIIEGGRA